MIFFFFFFFFSDEASFVLLTDPHLALADMHTRLSQLPTHEHRSVCCTSDSVMSGTFGTRTLANAPASPSALTVLPASPTRHLCFRRISTTWLLSSKMSSQSPTSRAARLAAVCCKYPHYCGQSAPVVAPESQQICSVMRSWRCLWI